jgi:hypothetical protein
MPKRTRWFRGWSPRLLAAVLLAGCPDAGNKPAPTPPADADAAGYENPGGMWMPGQMPEHGETLRKLGVAFDPAALGDPTSFPLGAVVSLGGCSASFVSPEGLVITNHHCVTGALQHNSSREQNLLDEGYLAKTRADEKWAGPTARIYVTRSFRDVTADVTQGLDAITDPAARFTELEKRTTTLEAACEAKRSDVECDVASYFEGAQFFEIEKLEIRDVRLVYAPHAGVGVFGGEIDNWRWPRHTGDYAFLRAYVGPDGKPAEHAAANVPYVPPHHLKIASAPLQPGDFAMVAGYPGRTYRLRTADEVEHAVQWYYPHRITKADAEIATLEAITKSRPELEIAAASRLRRLHNGRTNFQGMLDGLSRGGLLARKQELEAGLQAWIDSEPQRKQQYGSVLADMAAAAEEYRAHREHDAAVEELLEASKLLEIAGSVWEHALRRRADLGDVAAQQDATRKAKALTRSYARELDQAMLALAIQRAAALSEKQRPDAVLAALLGDAKIAGDATKVRAALDRVYKQTKLGDEGERVELLATATVKRLDGSRDPFLRLARQLDRLTVEVRRRKQRYEGAMAALRPRYVAALREYADRPIAPDANGTLRITFGTVRGYRPTAAAKEYAPFTTVGEMVAKHTGHEPFAAPAGVLAAARASEASGYVDDALGDIPLDFLADLDITGGNSGSATLNARGELIGLAFDGNYESIASDWVFTPATSRSIHVDIRYILWLMDRVDGAQHLMREMGVQPKSTATADPGAGSRARSTG